MPPGYPQQSAPPYAPAQPSAPTPATKPNARERFFTRLGFRLSVLSAIIGIVYALFLFSGSIPSSLFTVLAGAGIIITRAASIVGAVAIFYGWWRFFQRFRREARQHNAQAAQSSPFAYAYAGAQPAPLATGVRRKANLGRLFSLLVLAGSFSATAKFSSSFWTFNWHLSNSCQWGTNQPLTCQFDLTNDSTSSLTFNWQGTTYPAGAATFSPSSGTLSPGDAASINVTATAYFCPLDIIFLDSDNNANATYHWNGACQGASAPSLPGAAPIAQASRSTS
jgi:hypothetical protein